MYAFLNIHVADLCVCVCECAVIPFCIVRGTWTQGEERGGQYRWESPLRRSNKQFHLEEIKQNNSKYNVAGGSNPHLLIRGDDVLFFSLN